MTPAKPSTVTELDQGARDAADAAPTIDKSHASLAAALVAALRDLTVIEKGRTANAGSYSYTYTDLGDIVKATRRVLADHGLVVVQLLGHHGTDPAVTTVILHESGESLSSDPFPFPRGKDAQATGSFVTYMRRYSLLAALGLATGEDDDGAAAQPAVPWTLALAKQRMLAHAGKDQAPEAWIHFDGDKNWRDWEHAFPGPAVDDWLNDDPREDGLS